MKQTLITLLACIAIGICGFAIGWSYSHNHQFTFYNGEGEVLPYRAVDSLVHSQFMDRDFSKAGKDTLTKYFN